MSAIKAAMKKRGIDATVVIVRSDGSLMSEEFAHIRPIETLLCGPAASVMGSAYLTNAENSIVVDMGGTTTDIALINHGIPRKSVDGIRIGKWRTFASGLYIKTFGLGGDSAIHYDSQRFFLEDYRVVPFCVAVGRYPTILDNLKKLLERGKKHTRYLHEHYILIKDISENARYTQEERAFCHALKDGALPLEEAAAHFPGRDIYSMDVSRLLREGVVQTCGLTPTDIMHIKGDFGRFSAEASLLGAQYVAFQLNLSVDELCDRVYDEIKRKLYVNIVKVMLENKDKHYMNDGVSKDVERFINESYELAKTGRGQEFISMKFTTDYALAGVGAPIHIFLGDVARMLDTKAILPKHYEVANALGAVVGNVHATNVVEIKPNYTTDGITGYTVYGNTETRVFSEREDAEEFAIAEAKNGAYAEAIRRGARGEITTACRLDRQAGSGRSFAVDLGTRAVAQAIGSIGL